MLKINLIHLFDSSGIHCSSWGDGGRDRDILKNTQKNSEHLRKELVGTEPGQSATLRPPFFLLPGQKLPTSTHQENICQLLAFIPRLQTPLVNLKMQNS